MEGKSILPPKFVIAQTGRSGSGYISKVLRQSGVNCGHEEYFRFPFQKPISGLDGDSSWLSVPHLSSYKGVIIHQVRHPLKVLTSLISTFEKNTRHSKKYWPYHKEMMPYRTSDLDRDFMAMIIYMNREIEEHSHYFWRIEDVSAKEINLAISSVINVGRIGRIEDAMRDVSRNTNSHHKKDYLSWDDIPSSIEKSKLMGMADDYGY